MLSILIPKLLIKVNLTTIIRNKFLSIFTNKIYSKPIQVHDDKESLKKI